MRGHVFSLRASFMQDDSDGSEFATQSRADSRSLQQLLENLQTVQAQVGADDAEEVVFEQEEPMASERLSDNCGSEASGCSSL